MSRAPMDLLDIATGNLTAALLVTLADNEVPADDPRIVCAAHPMLPARQIRELYAELLDAVERHSLLGLTADGDWAIEAVEDEIRQLLYKLSTALVPCARCVTRMDYVGDIRPAGSCPSHPAHLTVVAERSVA